MRSTRALCAFKRYYVGQTEDGLVVLPLPLPAKKRKMTNKKALFLDLDHTLIRSGYSYCYLDYDVALRPGLKSFLHENLELFDVYVWTEHEASTCDGVMTLVDHECNIKPGAIGRLSGEHTLKGRDWMKYIPLTGLPPDQCLIIDDNARSFPLTPRTGIRVPEFLATSAEKKDTTLEQLMPMLRKVAAAKSVPAELDHWRPEGYECTDDLEQNMVQNSPSRKVLGTVTSARSQHPVPAQKQSKAAKKLMKEIAKEAAEEHSELKRNGWWTYFIY